MLVQVAAERVAWDMAKEHGFHLCVINPTFVLGPVVSSRTDATSIDIFKVRTLQVWPLFVILIVECSDA